LPAAQILSKESVIMMMQTVATSILPDLILTRLLVTGKRAIGPKKLRDDVERAAPISTGEQWDATVQELADAGFLTRKPLRLTDAGRARALAFLEVESLPPRANWGTAQARYLVPRALGVPAGDGKGRDRLKVADNLRAAALRKAYRLPVPENASLTETIQAAACRLVCEQLGLDPLATWQALELAVLNRLVNAPAPLNRKAMREQLAGHALGATRGGLQGLRDALLLRWLDSSNGTTRTEPSATNQPAAEPRRLEPPREEPRETHLDLETFAATVQAAARSSQTGRWGDNKVFINHVWRQLQQEPNFPRLDLVAFKDRLAEANQRGLLRLERADLVEAMNPVDVRESETTFLTATYHFILVDGQAGAGGAVGDENEAGA
jgi:hypothetical protein